MASVMHVCSFLSLCLFVNVSVCVCVCAHARAAHMLHAYMIACMKFVFVWICFNAKHVFLPFKLLQLMHSDAHNLIVDEDS